jgi:molecular chaperone GrpE
MNDKIEVKTAKDKDTQEEKPVEKRHGAAEKPLDKMTKAELLEKIGELQEESKKNFDFYLRSQAEIENIKKRNLKEKTDWVKYSNETLIKEILPVMDNLEMAISHSHNQNSFQALREGVELTLKGLRDTLAKSGLEEVKAEGEPFDPYFHQAVSELEDENAKAGTIVQELQKGYTLNQRLIRPAMVIVSKGKPGEVKDRDEASEKAS